MPHECLRDSGWGSLDLLRPRDHLLRRAQSRHRAIRANRPGLPAGRRPQASVGHAARYGSTLSGRGGLWLDRKVSRDHDGQRGSLCGPGSGAGPWYRGPRVEAGLSLESDERRCLPKIGARRGERSTAARGECAAPARVQMAPDGSPAVALEALLRSGEQRLQALPVEPDDHLTVDLRHRRGQVAELGQLSEGGLIPRDIFLDIRHTLV